ncbi:MAG TPA: ATP-dependent DNA helicase RecG [Rhodocyclaceae bacterium]|nr:ATP-dependent DNA helicase RecG [Rhodocyclaceae bacterium]
MAGRKRTETGPLAPAVSSLAGVPGVNTATAAKLAKLGLRSNEDLALHLPLRFEDETFITPVAAAPHGASVQCEVTVISSEVAFRPRRQLVARVQDKDGDLLVLRFLNFYPSQQKQLQAGAHLRVFGEIRNGFFGAEMVHPRCQRIEADEELPQTLTPVYPTTAGIGQATLRRLIERALKLADLSETLPESLLRQHQLAPFAESVHLLHQPPPAGFGESIDRVQQKAWQRVRFDELLAQQISLRRSYIRRREHTSVRLPGTGRLTNALLAKLPFALTGAQQRVVAEISADLAQAHPMQRLLQGDVGSGKTVVAALAMLQAVENGYQAALMAPTEILAEQHFIKLRDWLPPLGIQVAWLTGSLRKKEKDVMLAAVADGTAHVVVGTHALIEDTVTFDKLGLAVVDEQHRFGVRQRLALRQKMQGAGTGAVHQLMMSATPIPRTLAMSFYADLDVSVIDELPPGRTPIRTRLVAAAKREQVVGRVHDACKSGRQAYWVCPLIEESETLADLQTALDTYETLRNELPDVRVGLVHGRMKPDEKSATMEAFGRNEIQLLVSTTVIEVGVDVPNSTLMVIEHAERFGLAQLHQLRGRVGRGAAESECILLYAPPLSEMARARLKVIYENTDGFEIARQDLQLRGPGEFIGARQSGLPMLKYADLEDPVLIEAARSAAETMLKDFPEHAERHLQRWLAGAEELLKA